MAVYQAILGQLGTAKENWLNCHNWLNCESVTLTFKG